MNKRNSRNSHERGYHRNNKGNGNFLKSIFLIIASILIIFGIGFYLKNICNSNLQKSETINKLSDDAKDTSEKNIKKEEIKKEPVKKEIIISVAGDFTLGTDTKFAYDSSLPAAFINKGCFKIIKLF